MEKSFSLSGYASLDIICDANASTYSVVISKKPYGCDPIAATLNLDEWKSLAIQLPSIKAMAQVAWEEIGAGVTPSLQQVQRALSVNYLLTLNAYTAPNGNVYVTTGIRRYFINDQGESVPKKAGGVSLSYEELSNLAQREEAINEYLGNCLSSVKTIVVNGHEDIRAAHQLVDQFWHMGWGKCRLVLEKPSAKMD